MLHIKYIFWCVYGDSGFLCGPLWGNNYVGSPDYRNNIVALCNYYVWTMRHGLRRGGANTRGDQLGADLLPWAGFCGRYLGPEPDQETTPAPRGGPTSHYSRKGNKPARAGPRGQGRRPDSYAPLLIVCLIILPTTPADHRPCV